MEEYLNQYFKILINTRNLEQIDEFLPTVMFSNTEKFIDLLILKLEDEIKLAKELEDFEYHEHLLNIINLLNGKKEDKSLNVSTLNSNVLVFDPEFLKTMKKLNDILFYQEIVKAVECLESKEWLEANKGNSKKYRKLLGNATGIYEVKTTNIRLLHAPINGDYWYVVGVLKKDGDNKKGHNGDLVLFRDKTLDAISRIKKMFTKEGKLDIISLNEFSLESGEKVREELNKWGGRKNETP